MKIEGSGAEFRTGLALLTAIGVEASRRAIVARDADRESLRAMCLPSQSDDITPTLAGHAVDDATHRTLRATDTPVLAPAEYVRPIMNLRALSITLGVTTERSAKRRLRFALPVSGGSQSRRASGRRDGTGSMECP
jgi:hypothetical protein